MQERPSFFPQKKKKKEKRMLGWCCNVYNHDDDRSALELIARARKRSSRASVAAAQPRWWCGPSKKKTIPSYTRLRGRNIPKENRPADKNASYFFKKVGKTETIFTAVQSYVEIIWTIFWIIFNAYIRCKNSHNDATNKNPAICLIHTWL